MGQKNLEGRGSKLWALVPWTKGSLHTKSWPPTMPRPLQKVVGRWVVLTPNLVFCFGPKLLFWPRPKLNNMEDQDNLKILFFLFIRKCITVDWKVHYKLSLADYNSLCVTSWCCTELVPTKCNKTSEISSALFKTFYAMVE